MISDEVLEQGIVRGIVTNQQVTDLRALALELTAASVPEPQDDEKLRFITGFSDIFVTLGLALFLGALAYFVAKASGWTAMWFGLAAAAWLLAEFFTRRRHMALPSIVLLAVFAVSVFTGTNDLLAGRPSGFLAGFLGYGDGGSAESPGMIAAAMLMTAVAVATHYIRFRVPITIAAGTAALGGMAVSLLFALAPDFARAAIRPVILVLGLAVFALAMRFDLSDSAHVTRRTDIAFWLHLLAAPLIVHPLISWFMGDGSLSQVPTALAVLTLFVLLGVVAVVIDRRAMLVSGLIYAAYALSSLISTIGLADRTLPATMLVLGAFVLLLSAGWRPVRAALLRLLPTHLAHRLPHPILSSS
jgi:hypothetical protein